MVLASWTKCVRGGRVVEWEEGGDEGGGGFIFLFVVCLLVLLFFLWCVFNSLFVCMLVCPIGVLACWCRRMLGTVGGC